MKAHEVSRRCREMGEDAVRRTIAQGGGTPQWIAFAKEWLAQFDHERNVASQADSLAVATSAKDAAWAAAEAAREAAAAAKTANTIATLALAAAVIAIAISIVSAFVR